MPERGPDGWERNVWALPLVVFVAFVGFQSFSPFLPLYIRELGVTDPGRVWRRHDDRCRARGGARGVANAAGLSGGDSPPAAAVAAAWLFGTFLLSPLAALATAWRLAAPREGERRRRGG